LTRTRRVRSLYDREPVFLQKSCSVKLQKHFVLYYEGYRVLILPKARKRASSFGIVTGPDRWPVARF
jgi:hypothetical protein